MAAVHGVQRRTSGAREASTCAIVRALSPDEDLLTTERLICPNCGANVPAPVAPDATYATCGHCQFRVLLGAEWLESRGRGQAAVALARARAVPPAPAAPPHRRRSLLAWIAVPFVMFVATAGFVGFQLWRAVVRGVDAEESKAEREGQAQRQMRELQKRMTQAKGQGCSHQVAAPRSVAGVAHQSLQMTSGGSCLRAFVAASAAVDIRLIPPSGQAHTARLKGSGEFEHCPRETGEHTLYLAPSAGDVLSYALVDCQPEFAAHEHDPAKNGLERVQHRLAALEKDGCRRVIMPPKALAGPQNLTAKMTPGAFCTVLVAAAGATSNTLTVSMTSPMGEVVKRLSASELELAHCSTIAGDHRVDVAPESLDYFTVAAMECPRAVAQAHGAK